MNRSKEFPTRRFATGLIASSLVAAGLLLAGASHAQDIKERTRRMSFVNVKDHPHGVGAERFAELVNQKSGGKMVVKTTM